MKWNAFYIIATLSLAGHVSNGAAETIATAGKSAGDEVNKASEQKVVILKNWTSGLDVSQTSVAKLHDLIIAQNRATKAIVVVDAKAGPIEKEAANDLVKYIEMMTGAKPALANTPETIEAAWAVTTPVLIVGQQALLADDTVETALKNVAKKNPVLRADAIVLRRYGNKVLIAGNNDESNYYAVATLLRLWGCRWYLPSDFGECIPEVDTLRVGQINFTYAPPFEARNYWIAWNGEQNGRIEFMRRNFMNQLGVAAGHSLGDLTKELIPAGGSAFNVPIGEVATAEHVAKKIEADYTAGKTISLGMDDGIYSNESAKDKELRAGLYDKYMLTPTLTDNFMTLYNNVAKILQKKYPESKGRIAFMAYSNITIPPQREMVAEKPIIAILAPIDIDPNHSMDDPKSPPRQEYREMMYRWAHVLQGRMTIYDYDQGMLVWRDIPNPSHYAFAKDIKHYRKAGILGMGTESRGAMATVFTNLYFRGQLTWNPDGNVNALLADFYPKFYGPAAKPMADYWNAIYKAWEYSIVTEHEYFAAPAIYTPQLIERLRKSLQEGLELTKPLETKANLSRNEKLYVERMKFTRLSFGVLDNYIAMVNLAAGEADYKAAEEAGKRGLAARMEVTNMNSTFTTRVGPPVPESEAGGPAWWPGEVKQYRDLGAYTDGTKGTLIAKTPLEWAFHRDPNDTGLASGWAYKPVDLTYWNANKAKYTIESRKDYPTDKWEMLRTDLYAQAQGVRHPDQQSFTGHMWYSTPITVSAEQANGKVHLRFPGLFNEGWLYVNGNLVARREQKGMWWLNDYGFEWDVDLTGKLKAGENNITLRLHNPHHFGGIFRRPFLYKPVG